MFKAIPERNSAKISTAFNAFWEKFKPAKSGNSPPFNVRAAVIDVEPETRKVRDFQAAERYQVYLCDYLERTTGAGIQWDAERKLVKAQRTEVCDGTHDLVTSGKLILPRRCEEVEVFAKQLTNTAKALEEDQETGSREYRYRRLWPDHYYHALNYLALAGKKIGVSESSGGFQPPKVEIDFDPWTYDQGVDSII